MRLDLSCLLLVLVTTAWTKSEPNQEVCFLVLGPERLKIHLIYYDHNMTLNLYERQSLDRPLPNCTGASAPVDQDTCTVCVKEQEEVMVQCLLKRPEAKLMFEGQDHLNANHTQCPGPLTAAAPATPATTTTATTTTAGPDLGLKVGLPVCVVLLLGVVLLVLLVLYRLGFFQKERIMSFLACCRRTRAPPDDPQAGEQVALNGVQTNQSEQTSANGLLKNQSHAPQTDSDQSEAG